MTSYYDEWTNAGYPSDMASAKFLPPPSDSSLIRAYHLTSSDYAISAISLRRLKVARFDDANDPFELNPLDTRVQSIRRELREIKKRTNNETGMLCFSRNWTHPMLWSHYADKHRGICLGFDLKRAEVKDVVYWERKERVKLLDSKLKELLLRVKFDAWKYEDEKRIFVKLSNSKLESGLYFLPFGDNLRLREVILGVQNPLTRDSVVELVKMTNPDAKVLKTRLEMKGYRILADGEYPPT